MENSTDARRALGVRPGRVPELTLNLGDDLNQYSEAGPSRSPRTSTEKAPAFRDFSLPLPGKGSSSPTTPRSPSLGVGEFQARLRRATIRPKQPSSLAADPPKGLYESQKLLSHLLDRLEARDIPPDTLERAINQTRTFGTPKGAKRRSASGNAKQLGLAVVGIAHSGLQVGQNGGGAVRDAPSAHAVGSDDYERESRGSSELWDAGATYALVEQLRDLLLLAEKQGLDLLADTGSPQTQRAGGRPRGRLGPSTLTADPFWSHQDQPSGSSYTARAPSLRRRILAILRSLLLADCHYHVTSFGPLSPPNALQAATLDIATYLYHSAQKVDKVEVVEIMLDGLYSFREGMLERVYAWLEGRMDEMLEMLARERNDDRTAGDGADLGAEPPPGVPSFSFTPDHPSPADQPIAMVSGILTNHDVSSAHSDITLQLSSLIVRLLAASCATTNLDTAPLSMIYRIHRLLVLILSAKSDASLDLLEIVAFAHPPHQRIAMSILSTYYPHMMGHNIIARRPPDLSYRAQLLKWETGRSTGSEDATESHHYIHWRVSSKDPSVRQAPTCTMCEGDIHGFSVKCTLCGDVQHLDCYRSPEGTFRYEVVDTDIPNEQPRVVLVKFSRRLASLEEMLGAGMSRTSCPTAIHQAIGGHDLHQVHLFTSTPCQVCLMPIWAAPSAVFACLGGCQAFFHAACIGQLAEPQHSICQSRRVWQAARFQSTPTALVASLEDANQLCVSAESLHQYSYDEIAILYGALWLRYQTLKAGILGRSLVITSKDAVGSDPLDLRKILRLYEEDLRDRCPPASGAAADFAHIHGFDDPLGQGYLFSESYLAYIAALLKSPDSAADTEVPKQITYAAMPQEAVREVLGADLSVSHPPAVQALLAQLELSGFVRTATSRRFLWVNFDLPLLAESSPAVEILVEAIAGCLDSLDLTVVEQGLVLLTNRAWPSLLCTPHSLERLGSVSVKWVITEEEVLHRIVREYASKHRPLPGLRTVQGATTSRTSGPVQLYQEARNGLLRRYIQPWLEALHSQDPELYAAILYDQCTAPSSTHIHPMAEAAAEGAALANLALDRLVSIVDAGIAFSCLLELLTEWLEDLDILADQDIAFRSLPRLLSRHISPPPGTVDPTDIFSLATETASTSTEGLSRACRWLRVLAVSGAEVPWHTLRHMIELGQEEQSGITMEARVDLAIAIQGNVAYLDPRDMAELCGGSLVQHVGAMKKYSLPVAGSTEELYLTRILHIVLRSYGVPEDRIAMTTLHSDKMTQKQSPSAAKSHARRSTMMALRGIPLDEAVVLAAARLVQLGAYPTDQLLDFLWLLFTQASAASNADETIYSLASTLYQILWPLVNADLDRKSRTRLLLKLITVNSSPLEGIIQNDLAGNSRSSTVERLLRFVLDLGDHTITSDSRNWRNDVTGIALLLFQALCDPEHADPSSMSIWRSLLPAHLQTTSLCFEASLVASSDERRSALLVQLRQLRHGFPLWPVISWPVLDELLTETVVSIKQAAPGKSSQNVFALLDSQNVRYHLITLGLDMLASGIPMPYVLAQRFQQHVAAVCALPWDEPSEGLMDIVLPAIRDVLDSPTQIPMTSTHDTDAPSRRKMALVGSLFVPAVVDFGGVLADKGVLHQRYLLDILLIIFHKHNIVAILHPALKALQNVAVFVEQADCSDNRILGLAIVQAALDRMRREDLVRVIPAFFLSLSAAMLKESGDSGSVAIVEQCGILLRRIIKMFGKAGLLLNIVRLDGADVTADSSRSVPAEVILRLYPSNGAQDLVSASGVVTLLFDELPDVLKRGRLVLEQVLAGLARLVPLLRDAMTSDALEAFGAFLGKLGKHIAEWTHEDFNPENILKATSSVLEVVQGDQAVTFPSQVATFLHLCLSRFDVSEASLRALLSASMVLSSREKGAEKVVVLEFAVSAIQGMGVSPTTLSTLLDYLINLPSGALDKAAQEALVQASKGCLNILRRQHPTFAAKHTSSQTLEILGRASILLLITEGHVPGALSSALSPLIAEPSRQHLNVFTSLLLSSNELTHLTTSARRALLNLFPVLARAICGTLRQVGDLLVRHDADAASRGAELLSAVLIVLRLAFLAAGTECVDGNGEVLEAFWLGVGAEWTRLISLSLDPLCVNTPFRSTSHSVYYDTVIFLGQGQCLSLSAQSSLRTGLDMLVVYAEETGSGGGKLVRAVDAMSESPKGGSDRQKLLDSVKADLAATERLRSLRSNTIGDP